MEIFCFFFQAEDGIRDGHVTGVQTCALPISLLPIFPPAASIPGWAAWLVSLKSWPLRSRNWLRRWRPLKAAAARWTTAASGPLACMKTSPRSEERRVGKDNGKRERNEQPHNDTV